MGPVPLIMPSQYALSVMPGSNFTTMHIHEGASSMPKNCVATESNGFASVKNCQVLF